MVDIVKDLINKKQIKSDNNSGTTIPFLIKESQLPYDEIVIILKKLHSEKFIIFRKGINGSLIFLKIHKKKR
jgi:Mor family transcriptional regulator